jgi:hypothetical protein
MAEESQGGPSRDLTAPERDDGVVEGARDPPVHAEARSIASCAARSSHSVGVQPASHASRSTSCDAQVSSRMVWLGLDI